MIDQSLISSGFPLVGGGAIGFGLRYIIKKLMKIALIALGLLALSPCVRYILLLSGSHLYGFFC